VISGTPGTGVIGRFDAVIGVCEMLMSANSLSVPRAKCQILLQAHNQMHLLLLDL